MDEPTAGALEVAAIAAYEAFKITPLGEGGYGPLPPWGSLEPEARESWRAVADAVRMMIQFRGEG